MAESLPYGSHLPLPPTMQSALRDSSLIRNWCAHVSHKLILSVLDGDAG